VSFKLCNACGREWPDRAAFLADPEVRILGYQVNFADLGTGLVMFNHSCASTLAVAISVFADLSAAPAYDVFKGGTDECPHHCLHLDDLEPCPTRCQCAFYRDVLQKVKNFPKRKP
jgi:hypothetical protein